jgi:hypothetical protein
VAKLNLIVTASDRVGSMTSETLHGMMQASADLWMNTAGEQTTSRIRLTAGPPQ